MITAKCYFENGTTETFTVEWGENTDHYMSFKSDSDGDEAIIFNKNVSNSSLSDFWDKIKSNKIVKVDFTAGESFSKEIVKVKKISFSRDFSEEGRFLEQLNIEF